MALEIERKFLVKGDEWQAFSANAQHLRQGYLVTSIENWTVRVRIRGEEKAWLTLKSPAGEIAKHEFEYLIPVSDAEALWGKAPHKLTKTRYSLNLKGGDWILDCFEDRNSPLVMAEVELTSTDQKIHKPNWCYQEVTTNTLFSNAALAQNPIRDWSKENLMTIKLP